ncbi:sigma-70 family RNA polymerase sigma factor [Bacillus cytotoxicus]|uniref:RNA polymerase, sigma-24 subunit, ECF subfamily n=1 Tax=Bacillus cytotoxicus (strain DSM 22905 / CIP 110041 / 391-98 / NVH 391-98) TaxID=315749 RepID=A7GV15_BACCN|nr:MULTISPECIES: sigma-70 family RNA polymerase sigma factor [Bacillus cereus group]ABS23973.1 RNA polymerase, sigma-24 subunit, ECF subfamily [Bacillus cytotoxicus NVH 391-98]AWC30540.1 RNA polymerase subunit sigma-70 [Bacillus cytotoxicus]AWC34595.1 RNA polymerase subunit sigma-70 [Bacillus cytotoxicus]AWC38593.1 RNA polymerase subunit sigma-70 [Bacillus cytotoxicus]AWC42683.1 RNA polymerase subunit sigma-70 [Bacillus cytotoxicus]
MKPVTFTEAVTLYEKMIKNQMKRLCLYKDYEEFYQCGLIGLWMAYERYEEEKGSFSNYAFVTVRGYLLEKLKKENRFQTYHTCFEQEHFEHVCGVVEVSSEVHEYMSVLNEREKHVITESFFMGKSIDEIAGEMGLTYYQVRWIYRQAFKKMRTGA